MAFFPHNWDKFVNETLIPGIPWITLLCLTFPQGIFQVEKKSSLMYKQSYNIYIIMHNTYKIRLMYVLHFVY